METIGTSELSAATGATMRQIDYWTSNRLIIPVTGPINPGSGNKRYFDKDIIPCIRLFVELSALFTSGINISILKQVNDVYEKGTLDFGNGISLNWDVDLEVT